MSELHLPITALYAGLLCLLSVFVANRVLYARIKANKLREGQEQTNMRVQINFAENVPLAIVMVLLLELGGIPGLWVHVMGGALVLFRILHAWGMYSDPGATYPRLIGAQGTFLLMSIMGMAGAYLYLGPVSAGHTHNRHQ